MAAQVHPLRRRGAAVVLALACAVAIAACGSSSSSHDLARSAAAKGIEFADCMRSHGVPNFPDPSAGGGFKVKIGSGINPFSPSFKSAQASCAKFMPGGGPAHQHPSAQLKKQILQISECMRRHGVSGFPDPTLTTPSSPANYSILEDRGGVVLAVPKTIDVNSPVFQQAGTACGFH